MNRKQVRAFEAFVNESGDALLRAATLLTSDRHAAEDVYQETLHRLFVRWPRVDNPGGFARQVMHNLVIDLARARQRRPRELELRDAYPPPDFRRLFLLHDGRDVDKVRRLLQLLLRGIRDDLLAHFLNFEPKGGDLQ